jgi:hypothetical protein
MAATDIVLTAGFLVLSPTGRHAYSTAKNDLRGGPGHQHRPKMCVGAEEKDKGGKRSLQPQKISHLQLEPMVWTRERNVYDLVGHG